MRRSSNRFEASRPCRIRPAMFGSDRDGFSAIGRSCASSARTRPRSSIPPAPGHRPALARPRGRCRVRLAVAPATSSERDPTSRDRCPPNPGAGPSGGRSGGELREHRPRRGRAGLAAGPAAAEAGPGRRLGRHGRRQRRRAPRSRSAWASWSTRSTARRTAGLGPRGALRGSPPGYLALIGAGLPRPRGDERPAPVPGREHLHADRQGHVRPPGRAT